MTWALGASARRACGLSDPNPTTVDFNLNVQAPTYGLNIAPEGIELSALKVPMLETRYAVLTDIQCVGELNLGQADFLSEFA
jgi:hypothetical protein